MTEAKMEDFIKHRAKNSDLCASYNEYAKDVQQCLRNIYVACWRFDLRERQIIHILNETLKPFEKKTQKKEKEKEPNIFDFFA